MAYGLWLMAYNDFQETVHNNDTGCQRSASEFDTEPVLITGWRVNYT